MTTMIGNITDGSQYSVSDLVGAPEILPGLIVQLLANEFIGDSVLATGHTHTGNSIGFRRSQPLYPDEASSVIAEHAEVPVVGFSRGGLSYAPSLEMGLAMTISKKMARENQTGEVKSRMTMLINALTRDYENLFLTELLAHAGHTITATEPWGGSETTIRKDLGKAGLAIELSSLPGSPQQVFGFQADTLIVSSEAASDIVNSDEIQKVYQGDLASASIMYSGKLPNKFAGIDVLRSKQLGVLAPGVAILLQRKICGYVSDAQPLLATPLEYFQRTQEWYSNVTRESAVAINQPLAVTVIENVTE